MGFFGPMGEGIIEGLIIDEDFLATSWAFVIFFYFRVFLAGQGGRTTLLWGVCLWRPTSCG